MNQNRITFQQIVASIQRMPKLGAISLGEVLDAVRMAAVDIGNQPWPWNYQESNIIVPAPFTAGTISAFTGFPGVTGVGTNWTPGMTGMRIKFGTSNLDYIVQS